MNDHELANRIYKNGQYLLTIEHRGKRVNLYSFDTEFYEIYYDQMTYVATDIKQVDEKEILKYTNQIDLKAL